jgi:hypothetical protein
MTGSRRGEFGAQLSLRLVSKRRSNYRPNSTAPHMITRAGLLATNRSYLTGDAIASRVLYNGLFFDRKIIIIGHVYSMPVTSADYGSPTSQTILHPNASETNVNHRSSLRRIRRKIHTSDAGNASHTHPNTPSILPL